MSTTLVYEALGKRGRVCKFILLLAAVLSAASGSLAGQQHDATRAEEHVSSLDARMQAFLRAVRRTDADSISAFFPRAGDWSYVHTAHERGRDRVGVRRFRGPEARSAIGAGGPLWASFEIEYEAQRIGLFAHQVMHRGTAWRRVRGSRFVPPGASASSAIFVEWRREGGEWVISAFGDETFPNGRIPSWCC